MWNIGSWSIRGLSMSISILIKNKKRFLESAFFIAVMCLSFYIIFHGQNLPDIFRSVIRLPLACIIEAGATAVFFVSAEGMMIYYLLHSLDGRSGLLRCISYSFIGFFYSGITPSATGGQPMQLYDMKKDGNSLADSSVVLMVVALIYKFVLVVIGIGMLIFWNRPLRLYLNNYFGLYLLGLTLNIVLVVILFEVMVAPDMMKRVMIKIFHIKIFHPSEQTQRRVTDFVDSYHETVQFLKRHKRKIFVVTGMTFLQRFSVFFLTYIIYRGFGLQGADLITIVCLQASVYIAVDMLPIPGAQGITELMYRSVFRTIFPDLLLPASLYVTRGINFYFLLIVSAAVVIGNRILRSCEMSRQIQH